MWDIRSVKKAVFHPSALTTIRGLPVEVRRELGKAIRDLQKGHKLSMPLSKPITAVGKGVEELRVKDSSGAYRVFYYSRSALGILVFHAFQKKTQKTPKHEIELGQKRLKELLDEED